MGWNLANAKDRIERMLGTPKLAEDLAGLRTNDLSALLMWVLGRRAARRSPGELLRAFEVDTFVQQGGLDSRAAQAVDRIAIDLAAAFEPVELSPLCPLGTSSVLAPVDQNNVEATTRGREVVGVA